MGASELLGKPGKMLGGNLQLTCIPFRGSSNTPSWLHTTETGISASSRSQFGLSAALTFLPLFSQLFFLPVMKHYRTESLTWLSTLLLVDFHSSVP